MLQLALPAVVVAHPQLAFVNAYANNDSTASALAAVALLLTVRSIHQGVTVKRSALVGFLLGWLALSKYSGLAVVPAVAFGLIAAAVIERTALPRLVASVTACIGCFAATCLWWFYRNAQLFPGDMLGTQTMFRSWAATFHKDMNFYEPASHIVKELRWWRMMFFSFWGKFGYMNKYMSRPVYLTYFAFLIAAASGWVTPLWSRIASRSSSGSKIDPRVITTWSCMVLAVVTNLAAMIWASTSNLGGPQGRYLFTSEIPVLALMLVGLYHLGGKHGAKLVAAFVLFNLATCMGAWLMLLRLYGPHACPL